MAPVRGIFFGLDSRPSLLCFFLFRLLLIILKQVLIVLVVLPAFVLFTVHDMYKYLTRGSVGA